MPAKYARNSAMRGRCGGRGNPRGGRSTAAGAPYPPPRPPVKDTAPPPMPPRPPRGPALTTYAKKYGVLSDARGAGDIIAPNKSGYTPTDPITIIRPTKEEIIKQQQVDEFQRVALLRGFNAKELVEMGAYPDMNAQYNILSNPVPSMFRLNNWEIETDKLQNDRDLSKIDAKNEHYSLGDGDLGLWVATNPIIWPVLAPVLKLVGRYLDSMHTSAWLDAFLCGPRREVPAHLDSRSADEIAKRGPLYTFHFRPLDEQNQAQVQILKRRLMEEMEKQIMFGFGNGTNAPSTNRPGKSKGEVVQWEGVTAMNDPGDWISTVYAIDLVQPLLRNDLSPSERFAEQWNCASVILHELGHALRMSEVLTLIKTLPLSDLKTIILDEPYFEDDIYAELGYSFEKHLHGGQLISYIRDRTEETPHLGFFIGSFPKRDTDAVLQMPLLGGRAALPKQDFHAPISASHFEKVHQDEFWDYAVRKWGIDMVDPDNNIQSIATDTPGSKIDSYKRTSRPFQPPFQSDLDRALDAKNEELQHAISLDRDEREAYRIAEQLVQADRKASEWMRFWYDRQLISDEILKAKEQQDEAWNATDPQNIIPTQRKLLDLYSREARDHAVEALAFTKSGVVDERHKSLLVRVNRYLRDLMLGFGDTAKYSWQSKFRKEADELNTMLHITFMILAGKYSGLQDPDVTIEEEEKRLSTEAAPLEIVLDQEDKLREDSEIETTLKLGIQAAEVGNQPRCYSLGHFLFKMFSARPLVRNIGLILMAHDESQQLRSNLCKMGIQRLEALVTTTPEEESARVYWLNGGREMLARMGDEKQQLMESAPCIKRRRSYGLSIDEPAMDEKGTSRCTPH